MFTVLLKEWLQLGQASPTAPENGAYAETLFEAERVDYHPPGRLIDNIGVLSLEFTRGTAGVNIELLGGRTVYVMNASGKTVATYHGAPPNQIA